MLYCKNCGVSVGGNHTHCPLCREDLEGSPDSKQVFPIIPVKKSKFRKVLKFALFLTVAAVVACFCINLAIPDYGYWAVYPAAGGLSFWIICSVLLKKRRNLPKGISWQITVISVLALLWDYATGWHGWSYEFVLPILFTCATAVTAILLPIMKRKAGEYLFYLALDCVLGLIPFVLLLTKTVQIPYPSIISLGVSLICLSAVLIFKGKFLLGELSRRMHL